MEKHEGLISRQRESLIATGIKKMRRRPKLKQETEGKDERAKGSTRSFECHSLFRPSLRSRFASQPGLALFRLLAAVFEFTSRRNLYENLTMLARRVVGLDPVTFQILFSRSPPTFLSRRFYTRMPYARIYAREEVERVLNVVKSSRRQRLETVLSADVRDRCYELYSL